MSKVKIAGHASGSGTLTIQAPDTSSSRTITLPDATGTLIADDGSGNVGIGETSPQGTLHVKTSDSGATAVAGADDLIIEHADYGGMSILSENEGHIYFGDNEDADVGRIEYHHSSDSMIFRTNGSDALTIDDDGGVEVSGLVLDKTSQTITEGGQITHNGCSYMNLGATSGGVSFNAAQIQNPYWEGQILVLTYAENPPARFTLSSSSGSGGAGYITLSGDWSPDWGDSLTLIATGTLWWHELSRSANTNY